MSDEKGRSVDDLRDDERDPVGEVHDDEVSQGDELEGDELEGDGLEGDGLEGEEFDNRPERYEDEEDLRRRSPGA